MTPYNAAPDRYELMPCRRCGRSGVILPQVSLGLWHNFGSVDSFDNARAMLRKAFDLGIFHFDLANNYGPEPGSAEENFGKIFTDDFRKHRDELLISTKAGFRMWEGPYGEWGSRKNLIASCDQSLKRMKVDYVDIFYHHRPDPETPVEESMQALDYIVRSGRALYVGISNYSTEGAAKAFAILRELKTPGVIFQGRFNMLGCSQGYTRGTPSRSRRGRSRHWREWRATDPRPTHSPRQRARAGLTHCSYRGRYPRRGAKGAA
ncbi:MAG: aldo/keto reductase [Lentisphaeria bacterium]|nr:aldo/keto reductase [Lentisphaeria bacterium]